MKNEEEWDWKNDSGYQEYCRNAEIRDNEKQLAKERKAKRRGIIGFFQNWLEERQEQAKISEEADRLYGRR